MNDKTLIIITAVVAVFICLILSAILFFVVSPKLLLGFTLLVGIITGILITTFINYLLYRFRNQNQKK